MTWFYVSSGRGLATLQNEKGERKTLPHREWWRRGVTTWHDYRRCLHSLASGHFREVFSRWVRMRGMVSPWQVREFGRLWTKKHGINLGEQRYLNEYTGGARWEQTDFEFVDLGGWVQPMNFSTAGELKPRSNEEEVLWMMKQVKGALKVHFLQKRSFDRLRRYR